MIRDLEPNKEIFKQLLEFASNNNQKINLNYFSFDHYVTTFQMACMRGMSHDIISLMLQFKANPNFKHEDGTENAFHLYCSSKKITSDTLKLLLETKAHVNAKDDEENTPFSILCSNVSVDDEMLKLMFKNGADPLVQKENGYTPFHLYCKYSKISKDLLSLFLEKRCDLNSDAIQVSPFRSYAPTIA